MPEDCLFDFPCSPTFRRYEDHLLGRESPPRYEDVKDIEFREHMEQYYQRQQALISPPSDNPREIQTQLWDRVHNLERQNKYLLNRINQREAPQPKQKSNPHKPSTGIEGL